MSKKTDKGKRLKLWDLKKKGGKYPPMDEEGNYFICSAVGGGTYKKRRGYTLCVRCKSKKRK